MEEQLVQLLANTQRTEQAPRQQAEIDLKRARTNPAFPLSLANIAAHTAIDTGIRQAALSLLRQFIEKNWVDDDPRDPVIPIAEETREKLRRTLLDLALSPEDDRKAKVSASYVVGKIGINDFPEQWPTLLPTVLNVIPTGTDPQIHGALRVLSNIIEESLSEEQFFSMAQDIVKIVADVALDENRKPTLRALAISIFRGCFNLMDLLKEDHPKQVKPFAEQLIQQWSPFFQTVLKTRLPETDVSGGQPEQWIPIITLKLQVIKTILKIKSVFAELLLPQCTILFQSVWEELASVQNAHQALYLENGAQGRMEDVDGLPYTLDFLVLEDLDLLNQCFRAKPVQAELEAQLTTHPSPHETPWMMDIMKMLVSYSRVTSEEQELWDIDCSLYLAEETSCSANYTARTAAGDLLIKLGEWFNERTLDGLFHFTKSLFTGDGSDWRSQEAALYLFNQLLGDFQETQRVIPEQVAQAYLELVNFALRPDNEPLLRARGFLVAGSLASCSFATPPALLDNTIETISNQDPEVSEVVKVACLKALEGFVSSGSADPTRQVPMLVAISQFMNSKDQEEMETADELVVTIAEALRAAIGMDVMIALKDEVASVDLLFMIIKVGAANFQAIMLVNESFEEIVKGLRESNLYAALCAKVLPTLTGAYDLPNLAEDDPLITSVTELLVYLIQYGPEPLPPGFVASTFPKLNRLLMQSNEGEVLRPGAECVKYILMHDHHQVFGWQDAEGRSGLEVCLHIIDRLLGPSVEDNAASEVGGLAAELVEKAGQERLGPFLPQLLQAVANRLATAEAAALIQSLILVFARLSLVGAHDVIEFLSAIQINGASGLEVVLAKWLENSINFAGYDEIRQNVIALSKIYSLNDPRLSQTMVKGDLIITNSDRIMTRSQARLNPHKYTVIPASLKILKVLIEELVSAAGTKSAPLAAAAAATAAAEAAAEVVDDDDEDGWEDDNDTLDLALPTTKADLMSFLDATNSRQRDNETHAYLIDFFVRAGQENLAGFQNWYGMLTDDERGILNEIAPK